MNCPDCKLVESENEVLKKQREELVKALSWIGNIQLARKDSWPTFKVIVDVANETVKKWGSK